MKINIRSIFTTLSEIVGILAVIAGVSLQFGWEFGAIVGGVGLVAIGVVNA